MRLVDTHCHLNHEAFRADVAREIARARAAGVVRAVVVGYDVVSSWLAVAYSTAHPCLAATVGIHPHDAKTWDDEAPTIEAIARDPEVVAVGETGLDYHYDHSPRDTQRAAFAAQLEMAQRLDLPVVIHSREADDDTLAIIRDVGVPSRGGVVHCFPGGADLAREVVALGLHIGVTGVVTFRKADALRNAVAAVPAEWLLLETDSPYLAPEPHRGKTNRPAYLPLVAEAVASIRGTAVEDVARDAGESAARLFGKWVSESWDP
jgi:TatD DNase family protein